MSYCAKSTGEKKQKKVNTMTVRTQEQKKDCDVQMRVRDLNASITKCITYELKHQGVALDAANANLKKGQKATEEVGLQTLDKNDLNNMKALIQANLAWFKPWAREGNKNDLKLINDTQAIIAKIEGLITGKLKAVSAAKKAEVEAAQKALAEKIAKMKAEMEAHQAMLDI
tara:strand:- start:338 stop:850 length:513 start_codon:yes stop_codon:yes gene_type:complete